MVTAHPRQAGYGARFGAQDSPWDRIVSSLVPFFSAVRGAKFASAVQTLCQQVGLSTSKFS